MGTFARVIRSFSAAALVCVLSGCGAGGGNNYEVLQFQQAVEEIARSSRQVRVREPLPACQAKPAHIQSKPQDSAQDSDDRHPSRWKRKLKASYA